MWRKHNQPVPEKEPNFATEVGREVLINIVCEFVCGVVREVVLPKIKRVCGEGEMEGKNITNEVNNPTTN